MAATPTTGNVPLTVLFDGSSSRDVDGTIVNYYWNFGDNSNATGAIVQHTYANAGKFTATLTITDNSGAKVSDNKIITVIDPNIINAPASVSLASSQNSITLLWSDNSSNETNFVIERAIKTKSSISAYTKVGLVESNITKFTESLTSGTHYYRVKAINSLTGLESAYSNSLSIRIK